MNYVLDVNSVQIIKRKKLKPEEIFLIKQKGRPMPEIEINAIATTRTRTYERHFNNNVYQKYMWMCGCEVTNQLFCFYCLLSKREPSPWTKNGVNDIKHMADRAKKHENTVSHINACVDYHVAGINDIRDRLSRTYLLHKQKHNENVDKNRHILRRLITCMKFCGTFELALRGHHEEFTSGYSGLIDFAAELDSVLAVHIQEAKVFKDSSKTIQNELMDAMFAVYRDEVTKQIQSANFIGIEADETIDSSNQRQLVVIFRYVFEGHTCERFWSFIKPAGCTANIIANKLLTELQTKLNISSDKLISQSYDGTSVMSGKDDGVQFLIRKPFPNAYFVHSYAHEFYTIIERTAQCNKRVRMFFANLQAFSSFFSRTSKRTHILDEIVKKRLPRAVPARWNFASRMVNTLHEYKESFRECLETIMDSDGLDSKTLNVANGLLNSLNCQEFLYWLKVFHFIMPHLEILFSKVVTNGIDDSDVQVAVEYFEEYIIRIRDSADNFIQERADKPDGKRRKLNDGDDSRSAITKEVCDTILTQIKDRFNFNDYLCVAKLFDSKNFLTYRGEFPNKYLDAVCKSYPFSVTNREKLKTELGVLYDRDDMQNMTCISSFLMFILDNLKDILSETYKLLDIICTTPMSTTDRKRCFFTLARVKTFLRSTMVEDNNARLNALAVLSIEKKFVQRIPDFDNKVIKKFSNRNDRKKEFFYK